MSETLVMAGINVEVTVQASTIRMTVSYAPVIVFSTGLPQVFRDTLIERYEQSVSRDVQNCILLVMGSGVLSFDPAILIRGIFELYKAVHLKGGQLILEAFPRDYVRSLIALGLPELPDFLLGPSLEEARQRIATPQGSVGGTCFG